MNTIAVHITAVKFEKIHRYYLSLFGFEFLLFANVFIKLGLQRSNTILGLLQPRPGSVQHFLRFSQLTFRLSERRAFGSYSQGHVVIFVHGSDPLANTGARLQPIVT